MLLSNTPEDIVAKLRMFRSRYPRHSLVLVEGQTDQALWTEYRAERCSLIPAGNKEKAVKALEITNSKTSLQGVAAIVDPDFWLVERSTLLDLDDLLFDDSPDIETLMINTPALEKVMRHTFVNLVTDEVHDFAKKLRDEAIRLAVEFGYFRLLDFRQRNYNLMLRRVSDRFADFIDEKTVQFNSHKVATTLLEENSALSASELLEQVEELKGHIKAEMVMCRGKDVLSLLALVMPIHFRSVFKREMSQKARKQTTGNELARALRIAFEYAHFLVTTLYARIRDWETTNTPYKILKPDI